MALELDVRRTDNPNAATILDDIQFVDEDRNPLTSPCALNELFKCQADGGNVYIAADFTYQSTVELENGVPTDLAPGCYEYDHCGSSPFPAVIDQVATWACENEQLLNTAQDASIAVAFVAGMMLAAPVVGVGSGVVLAGAGLGGAMSLWSCDQSDNGFFRPSLDLDSSCVATEIALGAVFAPLAGAVGGGLARRVAVACGWGGLEGGTSTVAHMTFVDQDQAFDASDALVGAGIGCATGGVLEGSFGRFFRHADDVEPGGIPTRVNPLGAEANCTACVIAGDSTLAGSPASATDLFPGAPIPNGFQLIEDYAGAPLRPVTGRSEIETLLLEGGEGARGIVYGTNGRTAHVWNAVVQDGRVNFVDFQIGGQASFDLWDSFAFVRTN